MLSTASSASSTEPTNLGLLRSPRRGSASAPRDLPVHSEQLGGRNRNTSNCSSAKPNETSLGFSHNSLDPCPLNEQYSPDDHTQEQEASCRLAPPSTHVRTEHAPRSSAFTSFLPSSIRARLQLPETQPLQKQLAPADEDQDDMGLTGEGRKTRKELAVEVPDNTNTAQQLQKATSEGCPSPETTPKRMVRSSTSGPIENAPKSAGPTTQPTRLSLLTMFSRTNAPLVVTPEMHDELLSMKVEEALFPTGSPSSKDTFSPAAFKNLQTQATGLLTKMQNAYRAKAQTLVDLEKEREAEREECEEAETRAKHLKFQLEDMAHKAAEQEQRMKQLMEDLAAERRARTELERERSAGTFSKQRNSLSPGGLRSEAGSTISEDLGVDEDELQKRKWRKSNGTDTSFETDDDSISFAESDSVFSRPRSPSVSTTTTTRGIETGSVVDMPIVPMRGPAAANNRASVASVRSLQSLASNSNRRSTQQMTTFQKLMKGISGDGTDGCRNCKGQDASVAWDTVGLLRDENKNLKQRVGELEDCLEGALDAVNGIGL